MVGGLKSRGSRPVRASLWWAALASSVVLAGCSGNLPNLDSSPGAPSPAASHIGEGKVKAGLILPFSAGDHRVAAGGQGQDQTGLDLAFADIG